MKAIILFFLTSLCAFPQLFDVLTYQHAPNPNGVPEAWPAQVHRVTNEAVPPAANWTRYTREQLEAYKATHQAAIDNWNAVREAAAKAAEDTRVATRDQLIAGAIARIDTDLPRMANAVANFETLTTAQRWAVVKELLELVHFMARVQKAQLQNELQ
jgi:hypothetical protein